MLQNQHRSDHGDALVSSPTPCICFFKPFRLFYYLSYGRVQSIVENKHGEWMLMHGLFCFFSSYQVAFQSCCVRFTPFATGFGFGFGFFEQVLIVAPQLAQQWEEGIMTSTCHILGLKSRKICVLLPVLGQTLLWGRQPSSPPVPARLSTTLASELGRLELVRLQSDRGAPESNSSKSCAWPACRAADEQATSGTGSTFR